MPVEQDLPKYFQSFSEELNAVKNRVRSIIGKKHWVSDGTHKENVLQDVLRRFLPVSYEIGSGFVISDDGTTSSKQIDILIYDNQSPVFFRSSNFVIIPRQHVKAIIEVKTNIASKRKLNDALSNLLSAQKIISKGSDELYTGIFSFEYTRIATNRIHDIANYLFETISSFYQEVLETVNPETFLRKYALTSLCINRFLYGLHWNGSEVDHCELGLYHTEDQSFNFFLSNLLNTLDSNIVNGNKRLWYPTEKNSNCVLQRQLLR